MKKLSEYKTNLLWQPEPVMRELHERGVKCAIASSSYRELIDDVIYVPLKK